MTLKFLSVILLNVITFQCDYISLFYIQIDKILIFMEYKKETNCEIILFILSLNQFNFYNRLSVSDRDRLKKYV